MLTAMMSIEVLLVEDNPGDVELTRIALADSKISINLNVVEDGVEAMAFLRKQEKYALAPHPDLVLLDLNLPKKNGHEVLAEIKADTKLKQIPVVVLTTSQAKEDIIDAYDLAANIYITKPVDFDQFVKIVQSIENFWLGLVQPSKSIIELPPE
jgi:two-component system response regulator